eukprot:GHVU01181794.1.p2 GENE.GHVU01181794.1~~GHVU01181794.1.p2  ORF type:complete len:134 (+),score=28.82 GHVU01181794.1:200-601(+)
MMYVRPDDPTAAQRCLLAQEILQRNVVVRSWQQQQQYGPNGNGNANGIGGGPYDGGLSIRGSHHHGGGPRVGGGGGTEQKDFDRKVRVLQRRVGLPISWLLSAQALKAESEFQFFQVRGWVGEWASRAACVRE